MVEHNQDSEDDWKELVTDVDGFYNEESQPEVQGKVVSITQMELARRDTMVAILTLTAPCKAVSGSGDEKKTVDLDIGQSIGVVIKHKLSDMPSFLENQCEVQIKAKNKITLDNGNTLWRYAIRFRGRRTGLAASSAKRSEPSAPSAPSAKRSEPSAPSAPSAKDPEGDAKKGMEQF